MNVDSNHNSYPFDAGAVPSDPRLDALLDEALSPDNLPGGVPAELADRILAATAPLLSKPPGRGTTFQVVGQGAPGGRLAKSSYTVRLRWAGLAAAIAIVAGVIIANLPTPSSTPTLPGPGDIAKSVDQLDRDLQLAASETGKLTDPVTPAIADVRQDIAQIKDSLDGELASAVESWSDVTRELEAALEEIDRGPRG